MNRSTVLQSSPVQHECGEHVEAACSVDKTMAHDMHDSRATHLAEISTAEWCAVCDARSIPQPMRDCAVHTCVPMLVCIDCHSQCDGIALMHGIFPQYWGGGCRDMYPCIYFNVAQVMASAAAMAAAVHGCKATCQLLPA